METQKKKCLQCGKISEDNINFCPDCGSNQFELVDKDITMRLTQEDSPWNVQNSNEFTQKTSIIQPEKKEKKPGMIIAAVVVALAFIMLIISVIFGGSSDGDLNTGNDRPKVEYNIGEVIGNTYYNEWADLKITFPENFTNATEEQYSAITTDTCDCCLYFMDTSGYNMIIQAEDVSAAPSITEKEYIDMVVDGMKSNVESTYGADETKFTILLETETIDIAGYSYSHAAYQIDFNLESYSFSSIQNLYIRKIEDRVLVIFVTTESMDDVDEYISYISNYESYESDEEINLSGEEYELSSELSNDIDSFQVQVMDVVYQFPMMYSDFSSTGWKVYEQYDSVDTEIESGYDELIWFEKNGMLMSCYVYNPDISIQTVDKCVIAGIATVEPIWNEELYVYIPGGFKVGEATKEEVLNSFRQPDWMEEMDNGVTYVEYRTDNLYVSTKLRFDENDILEDIDIEIPKEPAGFQYSEVDSSYVAQYIVPTEMTDKLTDRIVRFKGDLYQLPVTVNAMIENGWTTLDEKETIGGGNIYFTDLERDGQILSVTVHNYADGAVELTQGYIEGFSEYLEDSDFEVSGGITMQMSEDECISFLENNAFEYDIEKRDDGNLYKIYYGEDDIETNLYIKFSENSIEYITINAGEEWVK